MKLNKFEKKQDNRLINRCGRISTGSILEALEPRLLLSADPLGLSSGADFSSSSQDEKVRDINDPEALEALIISLASKADISTESNDIGFNVLPPSLELDAMSRLSAEILTSEIHDSTSQSANADIYITEPPVKITTDIADAGMLPSNGDEIQKHELLFVDTRTPDYEQMLDDIQHADEGVSYEIIILDPNRDGVEQISEVLAQHQQVDAVHIVSHGKEGGVQLGNTWLQEDNLENYSEALQQWGAALTAESDLLFYGCNLAATTDGTELINALSQLTGADVAASDDLTGMANLGGDWDLEYRTGNIETGIAFSSQLQQAWSGTLDSNNPLWISTDKDVNGGGQPGSDSWDKGDLVQIADPNLAFEQAAITDGTFAVAFNGDTFSPGKNVNGIHYVGDDIEVGTNNLAVTKQDVLVFRPDTLGDYSTGSFALLLENPVDEEIVGITLIERNTTVGDANLLAGDFLFTRGGGGGVADNVWLYEVTDVGLSNTAGSASVLIDGDEVGISKLTGIELLETQTTIGGRTFAAGTLLLSADANAAGTNALAIQKFDIFSLDVTTTTLVAGAGNAAATASLVFDGSDVAFNSADEVLDGLTLTFSNNQAPVVTTTPATPLSYSIGDPATVIDSTLTVTDIDSANLDGGALTVSISTGVTVSDSLIILPSGSVSLNASDVRISGVTIGTIDAVKNGINGVDLLIHWNANSSPAGIEEVLRRVAYFNGSGSPDTSSRIVDFVLDDGDIGTSGGISAIAQQAINWDGFVAPTITMPGGPASFKENDAVPTIIDDGAVVADTDSANFDTGTLTVAITANGTVNDNLTIIIGGNVTLSGSDVRVNGNVIGTIDGLNNGTGGNSLVITWSGANATPAAVQEVVRQIAFYNNSEDPSGLTRTVSFALTDGAGGSSLIAVQQVVVNPLNDSPSGTDNIVTTLEDTAYAFTLANFGFSDVSDNDTFNGVKISTLPTTGSLKNNGVTVNVGDVISVSDINLGLLLYTPPTESAGASFTSFTFQVQDSGGTANGGVNLDPGANIMTIDVTSVNDSPTLTTNTGVTVNEGSTGTVITNVMLNEGDPDDAGAGLTYTVTAIPGNGTLYLFGVALGVSDTFTQADIDSNNLSYDHDGSATVSDSFAFSLVDGAEDGATPVVGIFTITVNQVNDVPTGNVLISGTVTEDQVLTANNTLVDDDVLGAITYQWQRDGIDITGATGNTYTLGNADVSTVITVVASYTDGLGTNESVVSSATAPVANVNDTPTGAVNISGIATEGQTLSASNTLVDDDNLGAITYQWQRDGIDIGGAVGNTYTLDNADVGTVIAVVASYTDNQGTEESVISGNTEEVTIANTAPTAISISSAAVDENIDSTAGLLIGTLATLDADVLDVATFSVQGGDDAAKFSITNGNELMLIDGVLDYESQASYTVVIRVTDSAGLSHDETLTISVKKSTVTFVPPHFIDPVVIYEPPAVDSEPTPAAVVQESIVSDVAEETVDEKVEVTEESVEESPVVEPVLPNIDVVSVEQLDLQNGTLMDVDHLQMDTVDPGKSISFQLNVTMLSVMKAIQIVPPGWDGILHSESSDSLSLLQSSGFSRELNELRENISNDLQYDKIIGSTAVAGTTGLSIGYVAYLLRGGVLAGSVLSSLPAWKFIDPTPILGSAAHTEQVDDDDESLESMVEKSDHEAKYGDEDISNE